MPSESIIIIFPIALLALGCATGCASPPVDSQSLEQDNPRAIAKSLRIPEGTTIGPAVPGLSQGAVPQGMSYWPEKNILLTSHYFTKDTPSCIVSSDWKTGKARQTVQLLEPDGSPHSEHVGGIVNETSNLWIASGPYLYRYALGDFLTNTTATALARHATEATFEAAFCTAYDRKIWVGEFALGNKYPTDPAHHLTARDGDARNGWICGYDPKADFSDAPEKVLSIPDRAQGIVMTDEFILLSLSYGRRNRSSLALYRNPLNEPPHLAASTSAGIPVPLWFLDGQNHLRSIDLPPMAENIEIIASQLAVLFESGAEPYRRFGKRPLDYILLLSLKELTP